MPLHVLISLAALVLLIGTAHAQPHHLASKGKNHAGAAASASAPSGSHSSSGSSGKSRRHLKVALVTLVIPGGWDENPSDNSETAFSRTVSQHLGALLSSRKDITIEVIRQISGRDARPLLWPPFFGDDKRPQLQATLCRQSGADVVLGVLAPDNPGGRGRRTGDYSYMRCSDSRLHRETIRMQRDLKKDTFGYETAFTTIVSGFIEQHLADFEAF